MMSQNCNQTDCTNCKAADCNTTNCPCKNIDCPRHGNCVDCIKFHRGKQVLVACMREIAKNTDK